MLSSALHNTILWKNPHNRTMKQELSIAGVLLAFGTFLCWPSNSPGEPLEGTTNLSIVASTKNDQESGLQSESRSQQNSPDQQDWISEQATSPKLPTSVSETNQERQSNDFEDGRRVTQANQTSQNPAEFWHSDSDVRAVRWLSEVAKSTRNSPPVGSAIRVQLMLFGQVISAEGKYFQAGMGRRRSRMELLFGDQPGSPAIYHMCDGRFIYHLESLSGEPDFSFIDLRRVEKESKQNQSATGRWMATGELANLYDHLLSGFNFGPPMNASDGTVVIRGCWKQKALNELLPLIHEASNSLPSSIAWDRLPPQLPHGIEIVFRPNDLTGNFPKKITFVRFESNGDSSLRANPILKVDWAPPQTLPEVNDRMFVIDSRDIESSDVTGEYLARIQEVNDRLAERSQGMRR